MTLSFSASTTVNTSGTPLDIALGDFNGDGNIDLVTANNGQDSPSFKYSISVVLGNGSGDFNPPQVIEAANAKINIRQILVGDFNGDGKQDIVGSLFGDSENENAILLLLGDGTGRFGTANGSTFEVSDSVLTPNQRIKSLTSGDFNGDHKVDLVATMYSGEREQLFVLIANSMGGFEVGSTPVIEGDSLSPTAGDLNGDGRLDLIVGRSVYSTVSGSTAEDRKVAVLLGDGSGSFGAATYFSSAGNSPSGNSAVADLNGDGNLDVAFDYGGILLGDGRGNLNARPERRKRGGGAIADFNGDGKLDLASAALLEGEAGSQFSVMLGNGTGNFSLPSVFQSTGGSLFLNQGAVGDFNRDGKPDLAVATPSGIGILLNTTTGKDALVLATDGIIDASIVQSGSLDVNLSKGRLIIKSAPPTKRNIKDYPDVIGTHRNDVIVGNGRKNYLNGNAGNDRISGLNEEDILIGHLGRDTLTGGEEEDEFVFGTEAVFSRALGIDKVTDFNTDQDRINLEATTFTAIKQKISFASVKTIEQAQKSTARITYISAKGALYYNQNGGAKGFGSGGQFADFNNGLSLTSNDFRLSHYLDKKFQYEYEWS